MVPDHVSVKMVIQLTCREVGLTALSLCVYIFVMKAVICLSIYQSKPVIYSKGFYVLLLLSWRTRMQFEKCVICFFKSSSSPVWWLEFCGLSVYFWQWRCNGGLHWYTCKLYQSELSFINLELLVCLKYLTGNIL